MRKLLVALSLSIALPLVADEHLEHMKMLMAAMSNHGPVIPQPDAIAPTAAVTINITASTTSSSSPGAFKFTPASFSVNQGDVVTINISVPTSDLSDNGIGHGILMDTYIENGVSVPRGASRTISFTATTAGTFAFICTQSSCGVGHSNMFGQMVVNAAAAQPPSISSVFPTSGTTEGGTTLIITGSNFQTGGTTTVRFGTTSASSVNVTSSTSISVVTPAHAAGAVNVTVTNPDAQSATATNAFTYVTPAPAINSVTPNTGSTAGGTQITISGSGFQSGATVTVGGLAATNVNVVNSSTINAATPVGPANEQVALAKDVTVTNPDGLTATRTGAFTYFVPALSVITLAPATGGTTGGTVVTMTGTGFTTALASSVKFGGVLASNVTIVSAVTLRATAPAHAAGTADIVVTMGGGSVTKTGAFTYQDVSPRRRAAHH